MTDRAPEERRSAETPSDARLGGRAGEPADAPGLAEIRRLVRLALWAALIGAGGWISFPLPGVALSLQTFFVVLAGLVEGPRGGALAAGLYLLAGLLGLPVFTGGVAGPAILFRPSAGFALAFPLLAAVAGLASPGRQLARTGRYRWGAGFLLAVLGHLAMYFFGWLGLVVNARMEPLAAGMFLLTFVPGDLVKCAAAASLAPMRLFGRRDSWTDQKS